MYQNVGLHGYVGADAKLKKDYNNLIACLKIPKIKNLHQKIEKVTDPALAKKSNTREIKPLDMSDWHTCDSVHCWGGWIVHLAGKDGKALEKVLDTSLVAALIMRESTPFKITFGQAAKYFFSYNHDKARAEIVKLANKERELNVQKKKAN